MKKKYWESEGEAEEPDTKTEATPEGTPGVEPQAGDPQTDPWPEPATPEAVIANDLINMLKARTDVGSMPVSYALDHLQQIVRTLQHLPVDPPPPPPPPGDPPDDAPAE